MNLKKVNRNNTRNAKCEEQTRKQTRQVKGHLIIMVKYEIIEHMLNGIREGKKERKGGRSKVRRYEYTEFTKLNSKVNENIKPQI